MAAKELIRSVLVVLLAAPGFRAGAAASRGVTLTAAEVAKLGVTTAVAQSVTYTPGEEGFGVVLSHDLIAQATADLEVASAAARQSQAALDRVKRLAGGPGALGTDALETAVHQVTADQAALTLSRRKLTATFGRQFTVKVGGSEAALKNLANGTAKLARVTFSSTAFGAVFPGTLRLNLLDPTTTHSSFTSRVVWEAPQDPTLPGRSYFALLTTDEIPEGARLQALPIVGSGATGVLVPAAAVIISDARYWCYVKSKEGMFTRIAIDIGRPLADGYFVPEGIAAHAEVVTSAAGLLLARETNAGSGADD